MRRIMAGLICVLVVLAFSICGAADVKKMKKLKDNQSFKLEFTADGKDKKIKFEFKGYDKDGKPIITEENGEPWGEIVSELPEDAEEILSIHYVNPCCVRINGVRRCKPGC